MRKKDFSELSFPEAASSVCKTPTISQARVEVLRQVDGSKRADPLIISSWGRKDESYEESDVASEPVVLL